VSKRARTEDFDERCKSALPPKPTGAAAQPLLLHLDSLIGEDGAGYHPHRPIAALFRGWAMREWCLLRNGGQPVGGAEGALPDGALELLLPDESVAVPQQTNGTDCGVFAVRIADMLGEATRRGGPWHRLSADALAAARSGADAHGRIAAPPGLANFGMPEVALLRAVVSELVAACSEAGGVALAALSTPRLEGEGGDAGDGVLREAVRDAQENRAGAHVAVEGLGSLFSGAVQKKQRTGG
jgi:hypothetical protein